MQESSFYIKLIQGPFKIDSQRNLNLNWIEFSHKGECVGEVYAKSLLDTKPKQERELGLKMARFQLSWFDQVAAVGVLVTSMWYLSLFL